MNAKVVVPIVAVLVLGAIWFTRSEQQKPEKDDAAAVTKKDDTNAAPMTDDERAKYVEQFLEVTEIHIDPDTTPGDPDGGVKVVPGLFRVWGTVTNKGERPVDTVTLTVALLDDKGEVISTYPENVAAGRAITPGEARRFKFTIPDKKSYSGKFLHKLR